MPSRLSTNCRSKVFRHGLSVVEFVGCLVALCGGVAMGSIYLGVDLQGFAADVLRSSQISEQEDLISADTSGDPLPSDTEETLPDPSQTGEQNDQVAGHRSASPKDEAVAPTEPAAPSETESNQLEDLTETQREQATHAYWKILTACVQEEARSRHSGVKNIENWQLLDHLTYRLNGHQGVVDIVEQLDDHGVDERVIFHAKQVKAWHLAGVKLNQRALDLITDGPKADLSGPVAQSWQSAATQHRMEEKLIQEKHLGVASYLAHTYESLGPSS